MALVTVLLVFILLTVMGLGLLTLVSSNVKMSAGDRDFQSAYYTAEAGVTYSYYTKVEPMIIPSYTSTKSESEFFSKVEGIILTGAEPQALTELQFEEVLGKIPEATVKIVRLNTSNPRDYKIISTGIIGNKSRTIEQTFSIKWVPKDSLNIPNNTTVFVNTNIQLTGGATINGNAGTISSAANTISLDGGASIQDGVFYVPNGAEDIALDAPSWMKVPEPVGINIEMTDFELPQFPTFPSYPLHDDVEYKKSDYNKYDVIKDGNLRVDSWMVEDYTLNLESNTSFKEIKIDQNNTLNIDTGTSDKIIVVDNLNISNGHINISGSGKLTIYVKDTINMGAGSKVNNGGPIENLNVYLKGSSNPNSPKKLKLGGNQMIYGSLFAEDADIEIGGGGGFQGHIFTGGKNFIINGGARTISSLLYAPNAAFKLTGGGSIVGSIVADSFSGSGGTSATFEEIPYESLPFVPSGGASVDDLLSKGKINEI